ncbi:hypothetical protein [Parafrankia sp. FMc2]|uniref:hypothetical protein n=1 Tax=Parafrankia sp. FMc2 TaxID=3233196 RepID=UPI0034D42E08
MIRMNGGEAVDAVDEFGPIDPEIFTLSRTSANEVLYDGPAIEQETGLECRLVMTACWAPDHRLRWQAEFNEDLPPNLIYSSGDYGFILKSADAYVDTLLDKINGSPVDSRRLRGWMGRSFVAGRSDQAASYTKLRWVNLADMGEGLPLDPAEGVAGHRWLGRKRWIIGDWEMAIDARPDLDETLEEIQESRGFAVTHLATLRRIDRAPFIPEELEPALFAYQLAASFALSRWASPSLSAGVDASGAVVWREWGVRRTDRLEGVLRWWGKNLEPIEDIVDRVGRRALHPQWGMAARLIIQGYLASAHGGFVEERITVGFAALEQLGWQRNVIEGGADEKQYDRGLSASKRLRMALDAASIPLDVPASLPVLQDFIASQEDKADDPKDGPRAITLVRHKLMHPKDPQILYGRKGLVTEAWQLLEIYIPLLILHWVDYSGRVKDPVMLLNDAQTIWPVPWPKSPAP